MFDSPSRSTGDLHKTIPYNIARQLVNNYLEVYDSDDDREQWFGKVKDISVKHGFGRDMKLFKKSFTFGWPTSTMRPLCLKRCSGLQLRKATEASWMPWPMKRASRMCSTVVTSIMPGSTTIAIAVFSLLRTSSIYFCRILFLVKYYSFESIS